MSMCVDVSLSINDREGGGGGTCSPISWQRGCDLARQEMNL